MTAEFRKSIEMIWDAIYRVPYMAGYGEFWALSPHERKALTESSENLLNSIPDSKRKAIVSAMNAYVPVTAFISTVAIITYPRVMATKTLMKGNQNAFAATNRDSGKTTGIDVEPNAEHESAFAYVSNTPFHA